MVDRVYRADLPRLRAELLSIRSELSSIKPKTVWVRLRIDPLLQHLRRLESLLGDLDTSAPRGIVTFLHSDLVYLRHNVSGLNRVLASEKSYRRGSRRGG